MLYLFGFEKIGVSKGSREWGGGVKCLFLELYLRYFQTKKGKALVVMLINKDFFCGFPKRKREIALINNDLLFTRPVTVSVMVLILEGNLVIG